MSSPGGSIEAIAKAKAGIMKPDRPVVIAKQPYPEALQVLEQHAKQLNCRIVHPADCIALTHKEIVQEGTTVVQIASAEPHGLAWMKPTGQISTLLYARCCVLASCLCTQMPAWYCWKLV